MHMFWNCRAHICIDLWFVSQLREGTVRYGYWKESSETVFISCVWIHQTYSCNATSRHLSSAQRSSAIKVVFASLMVVQSTCAVALPACFFFGGGGHQRANAFFSKHFSKSLEHFPPLWPKAAMVWGVRVPLIQHPWGEWWVTASLVDGGAGSQVSAQPPSSWWIVEHCRLPCVVTSSRCSPIMFIGWAFIFWWHTPVSSHSGPEGPFIHRAFGWTLHCSISQAQN